MSEQERNPAAEPPVKGDPDFAEVARERSHGPADYDESAGNELRPTPGAREPDADEDVETPAFPDED